MKYNNEKVNECSKSVDLENIFRTQERVWPAEVVAYCNYFQKIYTYRKFLIVFYIYHKSGIKTFLKWYINKCSKGTH